MNPPTPSGYSAEQLIGGATVAARLYVLAALEEAEEKAIFEIKRAFAAARSKYVEDLKGDYPFQLLVKMEQTHRALQASKTPASKGDSAI